MLETITTYTTFTLWKDLILNRSDGLDGDGNGDYEDGARQQLADGLLILMATTGGWVTYIDGGFYSGCPVAIQRPLLLNYSTFESNSRVPPLFSVVGVIHVSRRGEGESLSFRFELACMREVRCLDSAGYSFLYYFYYFGGSFGDGL